MHRIFKFVEGEVRGLHAAAYLLGFFTLLSTLLALFRDRLLASTFGAGEMLDIYYAAFRIPDLIYMSLASMVSVFVLVPLFARLEQDDERHALLGHVIAGFSVIMIAVSIVAWWYMPQILKYFFPALLESGDTLITVTRVLLIQPFFFGLSGIVTTVTQMHGRYLLYAIAPLLYNLSVIFGIVTLYPIFGLVGIMYGVVLGSILHVGIQVPFALRNGYMRISSFVLRLRAFWDVASVSLPRTLSISANYFVLLILLAFAARLGEGSIAIFMLAFNLQAAPLAIIGASYSVAAFPTLAQFFAKGQTQHFCNQILNATRHIIFWSIPFMSLAVVLRAHIVRVVFGAGAFDWADTRLTAAAFALFMISLTAQALSLLLVRGYYAAGETLKPLIVNVSTAIGIVVSAYALVKLFAHNDVWRFFVEELMRVEGIPGTDMLMLPLAYAFFSILNVLIFIVLYERDFKLFRTNLGRPLFESFSAAVVAGFTAHQALDVLDEFLDINTFFGVFSLGFAAGIIGIGVGIAVLYVLDNREIREVWQTLHTRIWKVVPIFSRGTEHGA